MSDATITTEEEEHGHLTEAERKELARSTSQADRRKYQNRASQRKHRQRIRMELEDNEHQRAQKPQREPRRQPRTPPPPLEQHEFEYHFSKQMMYDNDPLFPLSDSLTSPAPFSTGLSRRYEDLNQGLDLGSASCAAVSTLGDASSATSSGGGDAGEEVGEEEEEGLNRAYDITEFFKLEEFENKASEATNARDPVFAPESPPRLAPRDQVVVTSHYVAFKTSQRPNVRSPDSPR